MKKYTIGFIVGILMMLSTNAYAAIGDSVTAVFAQFQYIVNGEAKSLDSPVLVYEGTSYLRTTDIANMLGYDVTYKADSRTIEFDKPITATPVQTTPTTTDTTQPTTEPAATTAPTMEPSTTTEPAATTEPTTPPPTETAETPPDNTAVCKAIRDDYRYQITMVGYSGGNNATKGNKILQLEYERDQKLAVAGCN